MRSKEKEYFDKIADIFDTHFNVYLRPAGILRVERRIKLYSNHCRFSPDMKILEIGCGTGEYTRHLKTQGGYLFCTDISQRMLKILKEKIKEKKHLYLFISDLESLSVKDNVFDVIVGNSILHHVDINSVLYEIFRILKRGGRFAFSEPNMLNPQIYFQKKIGILKRLSGDSPYETAFIRWKIKKIFNQAGFKSVETLPFDFLHPLLPSFLAKTMDKISIFLEKIPILKEFSGSLLITGVK
jgi:ubiquinone/menaquinone biosynthesis C-methylase UbiE